MGKVEANAKNNVGSHSKKPYRKAILGSNNMAVFLKPSHGEFVSKKEADSQSDLLQLHKQKTEEVSGTHLFESLKDVNKFMVKGTKLYESLKELHLVGLIFPYTLILSGPSEDLKIVKHYWSKRNLKSPRGYFIKELGLVQDFVVQLVPQSPFMSLTTALFDAVADLNHQNIFPTKNDLQEYLKKHYEEIKTPDMKNIHDCLSRLIKDRRLYHNGRGYFVLHNENILNELIASKSREELYRNDRVYQNNLNESMDSQSLSPFVKGFNTSVTTSSSPSQTDHDVHNSGSRIPVQINEHGNGAGTPNVMKKIFKRSSSKSKKGMNNKLSKGKVFSCGIGGTMTDSITILPKVPIPKQRFNDFTSRTLHHNDVSIISSNDSINYKNETSKLHNSTRRKGRTIKRSKSFTATTNVKISKEVSIALVSSENKQKVSNKNYAIDNKNNFKRSFSFGVGYSKNSHQTFISKVKKNTKSGSNFVDDNDNDNSDDNNDEFIDDVADDDDHFDDNVDDLDKSTDDSVDSTMETNDKYVDVETSFVDDSLSLNLGNSCLKQNGFVHQPHYVPITQEVLGETENAKLSKYTDLGSELSLQNKGGTLSLNITDLLSPPLNESLAQELKDATDLEPLEFETSNSITDVNKALLSPRSRRNFVGVPYESHCFEEILAGGKLEKDNNMNVVQSNTSKNNKQMKINAKGDVSEIKGKASVKLRPKPAKSKEERKKDQKERNSLLFEEKRASLKVMGLV